MRQPPSRARHLVVAVAAILIVGPVFLAWWWAFGPRFPPSPPGPGSIHRPLTTAMIVSVSESAIVLDTGARVVLQRTAGDISAAGLYLPTSRRSPAVGDLALTGITGGHPYTLVAWRSSDPVPGRSLDTWAIEGVAVPDDDNTGLLIRVRYRDPDRGQFWIRLAKADDFGPSYRNEELRRYINLGDFFIYRDGAVFAHQQCCF